MKDKTNIEIPMAMSGISAGFPSPAEDYIELKIDLNEALIQNPSATFFARVKGDSMINAGIHDGDILVIDRARPPQTGNIVVCCIDGEFLVKRLKKTNNRVYLMPENHHYMTIEVLPESDFRLWGMVTYVIHKCT